jgi:hypothetical protein
VRQRFDRRWRWHNGGVVQLTQIARQIDAMKQEKIQLVVVAGSN